MLSHGAEWHGSQFPHRACPHRDRVASKAPSRIRGKGFKASLVGILRCDDGRTDRDRTIILNRAKMGWPIATSRSHSSRPIFLSLSIGQRALSRAWDAQGLSVWFGLSD